MNNLSPIVLFVYNRPGHVKRTIESLKKNMLAAESELFVFCDGPKNEDDKKKVEEIRSYFEKVSGFKSVEIIKQQKNLGLANSVISGVTQILKNYSKVIVLEDDLATSENFLEFINRALDYYEEDNSIMSVTGYCHPVKIPASYKENVFITPRASSWGWATWRDSWDKADWDMKNFVKFLNDKTEQKKFNLGGKDLTPMLKAQMYGNIDSWAIRWSYAHFINDSFCVYPVKSKVQHFGDDKEGTHKHTRNKYHVVLDTAKELPSFAQERTLNNEILSRINNLVKPSLIRRIINYIKYDLGK